MLIKTVVGSSGFTNDIFVGGKVPVFLVKRKGVNERLKILQEYVRTGKVVEVCLFDMK